MKLPHHSSWEKYRLNFYNILYQILMNFKDHIFLTINCDQIGKNGEAFFLTNPGGLPWITHIAKFYFPPFWILELF